MIPAAITHLQESFFRTAKADSDVLESTSTHPCHRLSIPAAKLFWCRHCMQIFEDPITRWRHSKTCLQSSSGKVRKDKDGSTMQVFLSSNNLSELRREQNISRAISRSAGALHSRGPDLQCFICKTTFVSIDEMRVHVRNPCRKRPKVATPKSKVLALPTEAKTEIQIPKTASEIIYIKDGHQTVISLESPYTTQTIEPVSETALVETALAVAPISEELAKQPDDRTENKENNIRKRKRILPKEVDDRPNHKTSNSPKSEQQIALSLPIRPDEVKDTLEDLEVPPIKISKIINQEPEDETSQTKVRTKPLQTKEEFSQLLIAEKKDDQPFLVGGEHLLNGVITEQVADGDIYLKAPASPEEKIVTGAAAEAKLKDLFTSMEMMNKTKLSLSPKQTKTVSSPRKSPKKTGSSMKNKNRDGDTCRNDDLQKDKTQSDISQESLNTSGWLLHMPPINAGSVTLHDPLLDLRNGLPAEMLLDETTNTKPPIPTAPEASNAITPSNIMEITKIPSHIFDGDLIPSQIHSEVLFEEITEEKEHSLLVDDRPAEELVSTEMNVIKMVSPIGFNKAEGETEKLTPVRQVFSMEEIIAKENGQIFGSMEEILLPVTIDHVEEITHTHLVTLEDLPLNAMVVPIKAIVPPVEGATPVETIAPALETNSAETVPSVEVATIPVKTIIPVPETTSVETVSSIKDIPIETLASVLEATKIENVPLVEETNHIEAGHPVPPGSIPIEAGPSVEEPPLVEAVPSSQEPTLTETIPLVQEHTFIEEASPVEELIPIESLSSVKEQTDDVLPVMGDIPGETIPRVENTTPIKINTADKDFVEEAPSSESVKEKLEEPESEEVNESLKMSNQTAEPVPAEIKTKTKDETDEEDEAKPEVKTKPAKQFKCKACSNTFKTSQALQKHSRVPCILKHTRSLSQKILRPKQPCMKIEKKPLKKKLSRSSRRPKFMIPIMPITRSELIRPAVPKRPKRFSRRKKRRSFFIDEQNRILPYVNVIMSELSDKDRFFYKLGMINHCHKIPSSETTTTTALNAEASAVETLDESAVDSSSTLQLDGTETESMDPSEISPLSAADVAAAEPLGNAYPATPAAACVSDKENLSALAKGPCLSLPTLEKMDHARFQDPNCISPGHVKSVPDDPPRDPSRATGQSVQSTCWEAAPRLAQLPGVTQIVRVTSTNPSSADLLNGIDATSKPPVIPESDLTSLHCKTQSKKISKETVNKSNSNIGSHLAAKNPALKHEKNEVLNPKETFGNVFENGAIQPKTVSVSLQELNIRVLSGSVATGNDYTTLDVNKKKLPNSISKINAQKAKDKKKASAESRKRLRKVRIISPDKRNRSRSSVDKNSTKSKLNASQTAKHEVTDSASPSKGNNHIKDRNQKWTDSRTGAKIENGKKKHRSVNSSILNSRKKISSSSKEVTTLSTKKVTSKQNSASFSSPCKKGSSNLKSHLATPTSNKKGGSNPKSPMTTPTSNKKGSSNPKSPMTTTALSKKGASNVKSPMTTPTSKKGGSSQKSPITTPNSSKKIPSNQKSPMSIPLSRKVPSDQKSPMTPNSSKKVPSKQKPPITTPNSSKKILSNQKTPLTPTSSKKVPSSQKSLTTPNSSKKVPSNQKSPVTPTSSKKVLSNQKFSLTTPTCKKMGSRNESPLRTPPSKKGGSSKESLLATPTSSKKGGSSKESPMTTPTLCKKIAANQKSAIATSSSKQRTLSLRKRIRPQNKTRRKECNGLRAIQMKAPSKLTIATRSSPLKKAIRNQAIELLRTQKSIGSFIKKNPTKSRTRENRVYKPTRCSLKRKVASKSLQIERRNSSRISDISHQNSKKAIPNGVSHTRDCEVSLIKCPSTEILYSLSEKNSASSNESSLKGEMKQGSKNQKHAKPFSETPDPASPSRVTRRTQKLDNSLARHKDVQKSVLDTTKQNKSSHGSKSSISSPRNNLKDPQNVSKPIKDDLDHGKRNSSQEKRVGKKPEISESQSRISRTNPASPTSETKHRINKSPVRKSPARTKQRLDSPSRLSSSNDHSDPDSIPYLRTRSIPKSDPTHVKSDSAENDIAPLSKKLISKSLANGAAYSMSSRSKLCSEPTANSVSVDKGSVSDKNISSSFSTYHDTALDLSRKDKSVNKECNETDQTKRDVRNGLDLDRDSEESSEIGSCSIAQVTAGISAVSCVEQDNQVPGNERSVEMRESPIKSVDVNEKLKDLKLSSSSGECSSVTELQSGESSDPHDTVPTAVVTVRSTAVATESSFSINNDDVTNTNLVEYETPSLNSEIPSNISTIETLNPRTSIATQTDTSFIKETKTGQSVPSGSCDNVDNDEPLSSNPDPLPPIPSSPLASTKPAFTPVDDIPPSTEAERCAELVQENLHLDPSALPSPQEIVINNTPVSLYPPGTICEPVQDDSGLQADHTENNVLLQQSVLDPSSTVALESPLQQFVLDNGTDPNVLVQYLNSLDPSMVPQEVTFVIIQGSPDGEPLQLTDNYIIEQTAFSEHAEHESAGHPVIYALQPPQSDITTEAECIMTDSS